MQNTPPLAALSSIRSPSFFCCLPCCYYLQVAVHQPTVNSTTQPAMSFPARSLSSRLPPGSSSSVGGPSPALVARIEEKKAELENLRQLRDLSGAVANQMEALEQQLLTLSDGTEGKQVGRCDDPGLQVLTAHA